MKASVVDLRYKTKDVLSALEAREEIILTHRGVAKGRIVPVDARNTVSILDHPAIGMWKKNAETVPEMIKRIRKPRTC